MRWTILGMLTAVCLGSGCASTADEGDAGQSADGSGDGGSDSSNPEPDGSGEVDCVDVVEGPTVGPGELGPLGFPVAHCNPRVSGSGDWRCCSDDPAAEDGELPAFGGSGAEPYFAGANNNLSVSGMCVRTDDIPAGSGVPETGCPVPCDPTWEDGDVLTVCGANRVCCQTRELQPEDCVVDPDDGMWRPVTGADILDGRSDWTATRHRTHQDPGGFACSDAGGGDISSDATLACIATLSVANQRGFCMALGPAQACPHEDPSYVDACEQINMGLIPPPGG